MDSGSATAASISKNLGKQTIKIVSHSDGGGLGKGSNSESFTGRELMTPDEVSHMSSERELVFVAGHRPIYGNKLRYYLQPFFIKRLSMYQKFYVKEHGFEKVCKKYNHNCEKCIREFKEPQGKVSIVCPTYPLYSDSVTKVLSYEDLFAVNASEKNERDEKARAIRLEKEYEKRKAVKKKVQKINLKKDQKTDEKPELLEKNRNIVESDGKNSKRDEFSKDVGSVGENLGGEIRKSAAEKTESKIVNEIISKIYSNEGEIKITLFGESPADLLEYEESWENFINGK